MAVYLPVMQQPPPFQVGHNIVIGILDKLAGKGIFASHQALQIHRLHEVKPLFAPQPQILVAKSRGDMNNAGAIVHRNEVSGYYAGFKFQLSARRICIIQSR